MKTRRICRICAALVIFVGIGVALRRADAGAASGAPDDLEHAGPSRDTAGAFEDASLEAYRIELIEFAFDTASSIPVNPFVKVRSRAQADVVRTCLQLDQPQRALHYLGQIENWRRGMAYADLAYYCVEHGVQTDVEAYLRQASREADDLIGDQPWRRDRIRVRIAMTLDRLGDVEQADEFAAGAVPSEMGKVAGQRVERLSEDAFDAQLQALDEPIGAQNFDTVRNALWVCVQLYDRFYTDEPKRTQAEAKVKTSWDTLPVQIRIDLLVGLAEVSLDHADEAKALALADEALVLLESNRWTREDRIPLMARLAALRYRSGDREGGRAEAQAAWAYYLAEPEDIVDMFRAGSLRPLAAAYEAMDEDAAALMVCKRAIEEGFVNPNRRPRAVDLAATCSSMALHGVEPDEELWMRMREIREVLDQP